MNIADAKQHVRNTVKAYLAKDELGMPKLPSASQRPLFLIGAPGIGKTAIMEQIADELGIGLVAYSMTHHTRQSALGLPFIVHRDYEGGSFDVSEYTMSEIIASIYDYMEVTGRRQGILFLDEINCVSETLYPSMLQFLQFKTFGRHRIPDDWIVVCAGNPPAYNRSVHEFDIVTLDRLRKIEVEPDYDAWKQYSLETGIHPAVLSFLDIRRERFYSVESTPTGKRFVSARSWSNLSDIIGLFEEMELPVDRSLIEQYVQDPDIADDFALYYDLFNKYRSDYQVDAILAGSVSDDIRERADEAEFDERLALLALILDAVGNKTGDALERESLVVAVRDILRAAKGDLVAGASIEDVLGQVIATHEENLARMTAANTVSVSSVRHEKQIISFLKRVIARCTLEGTTSGPAAFATASNVYEQEVAQMKESADAGSTALANAFSFVEDVFGDGRELLVFTTELTARSACARFIARFGSEAYDEHSKRLMVGERRTQLMSEIDSLDL